MGVVPCPASGWGVCPDAKMVRSAARPIIPVRPQEKAADLASDSVATSSSRWTGSALAEQVLDSAVALGKLMQANYTLIRIYGPLVTPASARWTMRRCPVLNQPSNNCARRQRAIREWPNACNSRGIL